jgi:signal transduction histidine kinase
MAFDEQRSKSEREALTRRLGEQLEELQATQTRLLESDRIKTEFVGMMSHELRTPLNILLGYTQILHDVITDGSDMPASEQANMLERMLARGRTLSDLIDDTLSVLRLEAGAVHLDLEEVQLSALFEDLKDSGHSVTADATVEERWVVDADVSRLETDRRKLRQIVANLVGNARKFTEQGIIDIRASRAEENAIRITVSDTGCGIGADHLPFIFDLYRQAPDGRMHDGCGLGLYIVRRYTDMLQGRVHCESIRGQGTTFTVELPRTASAAKAVELGPVALYGT